MTAAANAFRAVAVSLTAAGTFGGRGTAAEDAPDDGGAAESDTEADGFAPPVTLGDADMEEPPLLELSPPEQAARPGPSVTVATSVAAVRRERWPRGRTRMGERYRVLSSTAHRSWRPVRSCAPQQQSRRRPVAGDQTREQLVEELTAPLLVLGLDLEGVELTPAGRRRVLRVAVDKDGGVTLDDVAEATREVSRILDGSDTMGEQPYTLEVSSPGVDRPLTHPRHWRRNAGRLVKAGTGDGGSVLGRVVSADDEGAMLETDGGVLTLRYADVTKAHVQVELNRPRTTEESGTAGQQHATQED
jgi:ribosome maturation factor RimP